MRTKFHFPSREISLYSLTFFFIFFITGCQKEDMPESVDSLDATALTSKTKTNKENTFYGPAQPFATGVTKAFVTMDHLGNPSEIGITISERILQNLPDHIEEWTLQLPEKASGLAFDHIDLGWNPKGHEPEGVYDIPHFDMHFYMISEETKLEMTDAEKAEILPAPEYIPENYVPTPGFVPMMGKHWLNLESNEGKGQTFDQTFIYGSYDGEFVFYEPMITVDYLEQVSSETYDIFQPAEFQRTDLYYPTTYSISYDPTRKLYEIKLGGMVLR